MSFVQTSVQHDTVNNFPSSKYLSTRCLLGLFTLVTKLFTSNRLRSVFSLFEGGVEVANARESRVYLSNTTDYTGLISSRDRENGRKRQKQTRSGSPLNSESEKWFRGYC